MKVVIVQPDLVWEDVQANRDHIEELIQNSDTSAEIYLLPEMFTTGFSMKTAVLSEDISGDSLQWMKRMADNYDAAFSGSIIFREQNTFYNRLLWVEPGGSFNFYDKRHLFSMGSENQNYQKGNNQLLLDFRKWRIMPLICYDLRFPVWSRNTFNYDLLTYHANWPAVRNDVWMTLLKARAIENQAYVAGINRVGSDGEGIDYIGNSVIYDPKGKLILHSGNKEGVWMADLDLQELHDFRAKFPSWKDRDMFEIK